MNKLNENCVYSLEELTSEERIKLLEQNGFKDFFYSDIIAYEDIVGWFFSKEHVPTTNAKELFYTLENVQVDCRGLTEEQIKEMCKVYDSNGYKRWIDEDAFETLANFTYLRIDEENEFYINGKSDNFTTITYEKFMELFTTVTKYDVTMIVEAPKEETFNPQQHYFNEPKQFRSLFELSHVLELNEWEFDVLKRLVRCRKKNQFKEDLQKIKDTIDIYLNEYENAKNN